MDRSPTGAVDQSQVRQAPREPLKQTVERAAAPLNPTYELHMPNVGRVRPKAAPDNPKLDI